nr:hypothetical protein [Tanacetum cinerariifolium]
PDARIYVPALLNSDLIMDGYADYQSMESSTTESWRFKVDGVSQPVTGVYEALAGYSFAFISKDEAETKMVDP